jgi:Rrf2 family protein
MQNVLQISKKIDYALLAMIHLASREPGTVVSFKQIALTCSLPKDFLGKIMKTLADRRLVHSIRGSSGGYRLARPAAEITFLDVIEAVEGPVVLNPCLESPEACGHHARCLMIDVWRTAQDHLLEVLRRTSIEQVARSQGVSKEPISISS